MKGRNLLKVMSTLLIFTGLFGISAAITELIDSYDVRRLNLTVEKNTRALIDTLETKLAVLEAGESAYEAQLVALQNGKAEYDTEKNAYNIGATALKERSDSLESAIAAGEISSAAARETQTELNALYAQLDTDFLHLSVYEAMLQAVKNYESEKLSRDQILARLTENGFLPAADASSKDPVSDATQALERTIALGATALMKTLLICAAAAFSALLAFAAARRGLKTAVVPDLKKLRSGMALGLFAVLLSGAALAYADYFKLTLNTYLTYALGVQALSGLFLMLAFARYKRGLKMLIGS